jgi:5-methylcytosine-specific restriction endonuclease McrA
MRRRVPEDRGKAELRLNPDLGARVDKVDDWRNFVERKTEEKTPGQKEDVLYKKNFKGTLSDVQKYGMDKLSNQCKLIKCPAQSSPSVCIGLKIDHPSRTGKCLACSGPYYLQNRRDHFWRKKEYIEHVPPKRRCSHNIFEFDDVDREDIKTMVLDELVEKHPDYEETELDG